METFEYLGYRASRLYQYSSIQPSLSTAALRYQSGIRFNPCYVAFTLATVILAFASSTAVANQLDEVNERAWDFDTIDFKLKQLNEQVYCVSGATNVCAIVGERNLLIDTGLDVQAEAQKKLIEPVFEGRLDYIVLTHAHIDHIGGAKLWQAAYPEAKVITHRAFPEMQHYLQMLHPYFRRRGQLMFPQLTADDTRMPEILRYGGIKPDIMVADWESHEIADEDSPINIIPLPGAEGADGIGVWLPKQGVLFTGDLFGPHFPMWPNLYSVRGESYRRPLPYINSLQEVIELDPRMLVLGHFDATTDQGHIRAGLKRTLSAVQYVHNELIDGMNAGKNLYSLMQDIRLPRELKISEGYGKVAWGVRGMWDLYTGWFDYEHTSDLYSLPERAIYGDIVDAAGFDALLKKARARLKSGDTVQALQLAEILAHESSDQKVVNLMQDVLTKLLEQAESGDNNFYEVSWLRSQLKQTAATSKATPPDSSTNMRDGEIND